MKNCLNCGKEIANHKKYCNNTCQMEYQSSQYIERWKQGLETGVGARQETSQHIIKYLFKKYNSKCSQCGWDETHPITGKVPLQIHHQDGDATHNTEENLDLLCPNCHSLTINYGALNKGNSTRVDRYAGIIQ